MKNYVPNESINQPDNAQLLRNPLISMMRKLLLLLVFALYASNISAQNFEDATPSVMEVKTYIASLGGGSSTSRNATQTSNRAKGVEELVYHAQPSQYYYSGVVKTYGDKPRTLFTDVASLNGLNNSGLLKNNVEMINLRINSANELNATIDLSLLSGFKNLKYVYIISNVQATQQQIANMVTQPQERLSVFYSIQPGEKNQ